MSEELRAELQRATGLAWETYAERYSETARRVEARKDAVLAAMIQCLEEDASYRALLAETESATDRSRIVTAIGNVLMKLLPVVLAGF